MNVELESLPNCLANLRIEVESDTVKKKQEEVTKQYTKFAKLPGFRPGKAPRGVVENRKAVRLSLYESMMRCTQSE